ncbi:hypothetical protein ACFL0D_04845 [Thermoproteota archaeon]
MLGRQLKGLPCPWPDEGRAVENLVHVSGNRVSRSRAKALALIISPFYQ